VRKSFFQHLAAGIFHLVPLAAETWEVTLVLARRRSAKRSTRTLDVLHVAAAIALRAEVLYRPENGA
jgi:hypothetical protein